MRKIIIASVALLGLTACNGTGGLTPGIGNTLANLANNDLPTACGIVYVAEGYYASIKPQQSASNQAIEAKVEIAVNNLCKNPPTNLTAAFTQLLADWIQIQNNTTLTSS
jgi:hypothetical protein